MRLSTCTGLTVLLSTLIAVGCKPAAVEDTSIARWHFAGSSRFGQMAEAPGLKLISTAKSSEATANSLAKRLAELLWFTVTGNTNAPAQSITAATPLFRELITSESVGAVFGGGTDLQFGFCARIPANRVDAWRSGMVRFFSDAKGGDIGLYVGHTNNVLTVAFPGTAITNALPLASQLGTAPANSLLEAKLALDRWTVSPWPALLGPAPKVHLQLSATNQIIRTTAKLEFKETLKLTSTPWQLPTFLMNDTTRSFTAARGTREILARAPMFEGWDKSLIPDQFAIWMQPLNEFQTYFGFPVTDGRKFIEEAVTNLSPRFNGENTHNLGMINPNTNGLGFLMDDIPLRPPPAVVAIETNGVTFVAGGFYPYPRNASTNGIPAGLLKQLEKPDLAAYSWENTDESIRHWRVLAQLNGIVFQQPSVALTDPGQQWLQEITGKLGTTVTEIRQTGPSEVVINRSGTAALSGVELVALTRWIDGKTLPYRGGPRSRPAMAPGARPAVKPAPVTKPAK